MSTKEERSLEHIWHVWINKRQDAERKANPEHKHEHSLYEFKSMLEFLSYGKNVIRDAFENKLPTIHKQCSQSPEIPIVSNILKCARGEVVTTCPILLHLKATFDEAVNRVLPFSGEKAYGDLTPEAVYDLMAKTCAWHIYKESVNATDEWGGIDTSEGWVMDTSDRMFWDTVYSHMAGDDPDTEAIARGEL